MLNKIVKNIIMSEEKKYPRLIVGAFIFNDKDELFMMSSVQWKGWYTVPGGKVEINETMEDAVKREIKEETNLDLKDIKFITVSEGLGLYDNYTKPENHLVFINYLAKAVDEKNIKLDSAEGLKYKWLKPEEWLKRKDIAPTAREIIEKYLVGKKEEASDDYENLYKRALADYQNLIKRSAEEKGEFIKFANERFIMELLPVYDNLKTAINFADESVQSNGWAEGIKYVIKQFKEVLENKGIKEVETIGQKFDHNKMEAVSEEEVEDDKKDGLVAKELKAGYELNGKVIEPARVVVYKLKITN